MTISDQTPREHIAAIRKNKFGLAEDGTTVSRNPLSEDLQRAVRHLSEGLYSKETHFILELIQNAEDNQYEDGVQPDLMFMLLVEDPTGTPGAEDALVVINNERGFRPEDVKALCAVGATTKTKREGYIGEKGIGFKSVFVVSAQPHIFSSGYQFKFIEEPDREEDLGYIVPHWVGEMPPVAKEHGNKTCIVLPLKPGKSEQIVDELKTIAPETILFLSKLQGLTVRIEHRESVAVVRDDSQHPLIQFVSGDEYAEFWVFHKSVQVPPRLQEPKREKVKSRKISVALPLASESDLRGQVFAFLPTTESSSLPFIINADLILSTSREAIQYDRNWNRWLRDRIAPVFVEAFEGLLEKPEHVTEAYSYIPVKNDDRDSFFQPVAEEIHETLSDRAVVLTIDGQFVKPSQARLAPRRFRRLLGSGPMPTQLDETPLVHPDIQQYRDQLTTIGVRDLNTDEIIQCLGDETWLDSQDLKWFVRLYEYLEVYSWATEDRLGELNLIPIERGGRSNAAQQPIYFPEEEVEEIRGLQTQASFALDIAFLKSMVFDLVHDNKDLVRWLSDILQVQELTLDHYYVDLARALNENYADIEASQLIQLTSRIYEEFDGLEEDAQEALVGLLPIVLSDAEIIIPEERDNDRTLVMPATMDADKGWQLVFADDDDRAHLDVISDAYLPQQADADLVHEWYDFFCSIGATDAPPPLHQRWDSHNKHQLLKQAPLRTREHMSKVEKRSTRRYHLEDWIAPGWLRALVEEEPIDESTKQHSLALQEWLERRAAQSYYGKPRSYQAVYEWHYYSWKKYCFESEFEDLVKNAPWFLSTQGLKRPGEVFVDKPELRELFGDTLPYALNNPSEGVADWLGLRQNATTDELLNYLKEISHTLADQVNQKVVRKIYRFLAERWHDDHRKEFEKHPLILVTEPSPHWAKAGQAIWPALSAVFGETYAYLDAEYDPHFKEFFVDQIGVADQLSQELFARAWGELAQSEDVRADDVEAALERIYPEMLNVVKTGEEPHWWVDFCSNAKVYTQNDQFEVAEKVYIPDDGELKRLFAEEGVEFAWRPENASFSDYEPLYRALGVRSLVAAIETTARVKRVVETKGEQPLLTLGAKKGICFHLWNSARPNYERSKESGLLKALLKTKERVIERLTVRHKLNHPWTVVHASDSSAYWKADEHLLYRSVDHSQDQLEVVVPAIIARRLSGGRTSNRLEDFIGRILGASEAKVEDIIRKKNWSLANEEEVWLDRWIGQKEKVDGADVDQSGDDNSVSPNDNDAPRYKATGGNQTVGRRRPGRRGRHFGGDRGGGGGSGRRGGHRKEEDEDDGGQGDDSPAVFRPRLRSYVEPGEKDGRSRSGEGQSTEERRSIEKAGIRFATDYERQHGRIPETMAPNHEGWDIESYEEDPVSATLKRHIEVKATKSEWDGWGVGLTAPEFEAAKRYGPAFYLYVVEHALDEERRKLYVFRDPVEKVDDYRLDDRWKVVADSE